MQVRSAEDARKRPRIPMDDIGGIIVIMSCLTLIAFGKDTATIQSVLLTVVGFMFGKYTRKTRN